jgi:hypothetical protein
MIDVIIIGWDDYLSNQIINVICGGGGGEQLF